jgi:hypothetical protein
MASATKAASPLAESSVERGLPMQRELNVSSQTHATTILCNQRSLHQ